MPRKKTAMPKYEAITQILRKEITSGKYKIHERFLSEMKLADRFAANAATVRKAVDMLVREGLLYKHSTSGTFIAPRRKNKMILIVIPTHTYSLISYCAVEDFIDSPYRFQEITAEEYLKHIDDIKLIYPEIVGILFYRNHPDVSHTFEHLEEESIHYLVYGSSTLSTLLQKRASLFYSEKKVVSTALDHLTKQGCRKLGIVYSSTWPADLERFKQFLHWHKEHSKVPDPNTFYDASLFPSDTKERYQCYVDSFKSGALKNADGILATGDNAAVLVLQAALAAGKTIPKQTKIIGVNNDPICELIQPQLSSIDIPVASDAFLAACALIEMIEGKNTTPKLRSQIKLVKREST